MANTRHPRWGEYGDVDESDDNPWDGVDPELLAEFVQQLTGQGDAVMLSRSGDGGVARVMLFSGDERKKKYFHDPAKLNQYLKKLADHIRSVSD